MATGFFSRYGDQLRLIAGGVCVLGAMMVLCLVLLGYDSDWLSTVKDKEKNRPILAQYSSLINAIQADTTLRAVVSPSSSAIGVAHAVTNAQYAALRASIQSAIAATLLAQIDSLYTTYEASTTATAALSAHVDLVSALSDAMFFVIRNRLSYRAQTLVDQLAIQQAKWRMTSLAAQLGLAHRSKFSGSAAGAVELSELARSRYAAMKATNVLTTGAASVITAGFPTNLLSTAASTVAACYAPLSPAVNTSVKTATVNSASISSMSAAWYLAAESQEPISLTSDTVQTRIIVFAVGAGLAFFGAVLSIVIFVRHTIDTRRSRQLLLSFKDADAAKLMVEQYMPILCDMRLLQGRMPSAPRNDVEREYSSAAKLMVQLRPLLPQALFGELNARHKRLPNGAWDIAGQSVRLEMGMAFCHCTVLTIAVSSSVLNHGDKSNVAQVLQEASMALNAICEEVNNAGGIVIGCGSGGRVSCVWNATHLVDDAAFVAVRTARIIDRRLAMLNIGRDLNIASGPCIVANSKVGNRKHVTFIGGAFDVAEKLLLLNEGHVARLITDYETFKELPRDQQRLCKPIAVITDRDEGPPIVVMSADEEAALKGEQWKQYNTAFTLYQNNMLSESLGEFKKYLQVHPDDHCAAWLIENVLEPKIGRRKSMRM
ncbi:membrane-associated protein, putative [Bodo saltans]|uniref:Membrane-associated protein, putative n=1 Tax=Bodo saltans TaxID=75058 RepID=A0A0S4KNX2_BODSA|nr:membrane-associated protein, putative [Bodo saltans]|eukprot:CUI15316.1 membrane-associated protein, putative [Bodo saltans]